MWQFATSMRAGRGFVVLVALLVALASAGAGYLVGSRGLPGAGGSPAAASSDLSVLAAGTLGTLVPALASALVNETPGISAPAAALQFEGSVAVVQGIAHRSAVSDVAAVADFRLIPAVLEPSLAAYEVVFASTAEVLVYDPLLSAFDGINGSNWGAKLVAAATGPGAVPFAVWNASTDPNGYNEIFSLELQGERYGGNLTTYYGAFYSGAPGSFAVPNPATARTEPESEAKTLVQSGVVCAAITYRAYAVENGLPYVPFDPVVGLASTDPAALAAYAGLSTTVLNAAGGTSAVAAAPILFAATVPADAPNASLGEAFVHLLLSPQGQALIGAAGGFDPIFPGWIDHPSAAPPILAPDTVPMPAWAAAELA